MPRYVDVDGSSALDATAFFFDLATNKWRVLKSIGSSPEAHDVVPSGRKYHAEASAWVQVGGGRYLLFKELGFRLF